jgi:hypothetical protein
MPASAPPNAARSAPDAPSLGRSRYYLGDCFIVETMLLDGGLRGTAVLILPPLGYEDTCSYRPLRVLADSLACQGHVVLRMDWAGLGDSGGDPLDSDLSARRLAAVERAVRSLRARGFARVEGIGVRAGGLLALAAGGLDALVLWGTPGTGRRYLREEMVFQKMAAKSFSAPPADRASLPDGAVEAGGFVYGPETAAALRQIKAAASLAQSGLDRVLLIPREGTDAPPAIVAALAETDIAVTTSKAGGLGELFDDPYRSALSTAVRDDILAWVAVHDDVFDPHADVESRPEAPARSARLVLPTGVTERPWVDEGSGGGLSGIWCEPPGGAAKDARWTLFYNAGGVRRSGPNRLWTAAARALAEQGLPSLRLDVRDVGDSDGISVPHHDLEAMYAESSVADAVQAYDRVRAAGAGEIDVVGLCSGAFLGIQVASRRTVRRAVLFNGLTFVWNEEAATSGMTAHIRGSLLDRRRWKRLLTGKIDAVALASAVVAKVRIQGRERVSRLRGNPPTDDVALVIRAVLDRGTDLHLVSSEGDPSIAYLARHRPEGVGPRHTVLPGVDHTIRPAWAHARVVELILGG